MRNKAQKGQQIQTKYRNQTPSYMEFQNRNLDAKSTREKVSIEQTLPIQEETTAFKGKDLQQHKLYRHSLEERHKDQAKGKVT